MKTKNGFRMIGYLLSSQTPWIRGKNVMDSKPTPSYLDKTYVANGAIVKAMRQ